MSVPTLVTTPASSTANAYIDLAAANAYAEADIGPLAQKWRESSDEEEKSRAILRATRDIDRFVGRVVALYDPDTPQPLMFPRNVDVNASGAAYIAEGVRRATYLQAIYLFGNAKQIDEAKTQRARGLTNFAEPNVSGSLATDPSFGQFSPDLDSALVELREGSVVGWIIPT